MNEFEDLTSRLKALGDNPVPPPVATQHLMAMAEVAAPRTRFAHKVRVAAAFGIGLLVGGTGLGYAAAEGHLPDAAQNGLSVAAEKVGVELPRGDEKKADKADNEGNGGDNSSTPLEETVPCADGMTHGEYVSANVAAAREDGIKGNASKLAKSTCGKDATEADDADEAPENEADTEDETDNDGEGKAKGAAKKAENAPDEADPAGPPSEQPPVTPPADGDDEDDAADDAGDPAGPPSSVPPVSTPNNDDAGDDSED